MSGADIANIVYAYTFVGAALGSGILWLARRWVRHLTENIVDQILPMISELKTNGGSSLADRVNRIETRQEEMFQLLNGVLQLRRKKATHGTRKKAK